MFHHHCSDTYLSLVLMNSCTFFDTWCFKSQILMLKSWISSPLQTSSGAHIYNLLLKMLGKWSAHSIAPGSIRLLLPCFIFTRVRFDQKWSITSIVRATSLSRLYIVQIVYVVSWEKLYFPVCSHFSLHTQCSHTFCYYMLISMVNVQMNPIL